MGDDENLLHDSGVDQVSKVKDVAQLSSFFNTLVERVIKLEYSAQKQINIWFKFQKFIVLVTYMYLVDT